jgi:Leucine-rich repeat (LRR) protein
MTKKNLKSLFIKSLHLSSKKNFDINELPNWLVSLYISGCSLTYIPDTLINLKTLYCGCNQLINIPNTLINLETLACSQNQLTNIPDTLLKLKMLSCENNKLTNIPNTLLNLKYLYCGHNQLITIPDALNLEILFCEDNQFLNIPILRNLSGLNCHRCEKFQKAGINSIKDYKLMINNYDHIIPFLIGIKKQKLNLNNDIIYKLFILTKFKKIIT